MSTSEVSDSTDVYNELRNKKWKVNDELYEIRSKVGAEVKDLNGLDNND